jgi:hypothetical protein
MMNVDFKVLQNFKVRFRGTTSKRETVSVKEELAIMSAIVEFKEGLTF